jgi:hypothetical protein
MLLEPLDICVQNMNLFIKYERVNVLNKPVAPVLIENAATALKDLGIKVLVLKPQSSADMRRADGWLRIGDGKGSRYAVVARRAVTPSTLGAVVAQLRDCAAVIRDEPDQSGSRAVGAKCNAWRITGGSVVARRLR